MVTLRCMEDSCRAKISATNHSNVLPRNIGRGMTPVQIRTAIRAYTSAGITKPPSPEATAKLVGCGKFSVVRLFAALRGKEAELGATLNKHSRFKTNVEVDGHNLRSASLGVKRAKTKYPDLVKKWRRHHKNKRAPKYFLMPIKVLGAATCSRMASTTS